MRNSFQRILSAIVHEWQIKLLALVLAGLTFYAIHDKTGAEVTHEDVPVRVKVDEGIAILDQVPRTVSVTFRGAMKDLLRIPPKQIEVVVSPKASNPAGAEKTPILPRDVKHKALGVSVQKVEPDTVSLVFDREVRKTVPVARPEIIGQPLFGRVEIDYEPQAVVMRGPKRALESQTFVTIQPIDVGGRAASFTVKLPVIPPPDAGVSEIEPSVVEVTVNVVTETVSREWTNVTVLAAIGHHPDMTVNFSPETVDVSLHGRKDVLNRIKPGLVKVFVDCSGPFRPGKRRMPVSVHLPVGVEATASVEPDTVDVIFERRPTAEEAAEKIIREREATPPGDEGDRATEEDG